MTPDPSRGAGRRYARLPRRLPILAGLLVLGCQTVGSPRRPIAVTAVAVPMEEDRETQLDLASPEDSETRGLWVVRSTLVHPDSVRAMVERAADGGFNTLLVQVRGRGDAYYLGGVEPVADGILGEPAFDPLALTVREAHARGIEVHAWMNVHLISSAYTISRNPRHLVNARPGLLAVPRELARELYDMDPASARYFERLVTYAMDHSDAVEGLYASPSAPEVKERVYSVATDLVDRYDIDGIHLDYVRYPNESFDYSRGALDRFRIWMDPRLTEDERSELAAASVGDPVAFVDAFPESWATFRRNQITELVKRIYVGVKRRRPDALVSAAVFPDARESYLHRYQDWEGWLRRGIIDVVAPMAYNPDDGLFDDAISYAAAVGGPDRVWAGVGAFLTTYEGVLTKIDITQRIGVRGFLLFSYDWSVANGRTSGGRPFLERVGRGVDTLIR